MITSRELSMVGGAVFGGLAFAWMLPPTTPIGGPTVASLSRSASPAAYAAAPAFDPEPASLQAQTQAQTQPAIYDPAIPRIDLNARPAALPDRTEQATDDYEESGDFSDDYGPRRHHEDYARAFRVGYRQAERGSIEDSRECEQFEDPARADGCRKYVDEAEPALNYDNPTD
jgi:hypothetical protein